MALSAVKQTPEKNTSEEVSKKLKKVVVIGGGTGNFVVLRGLKDYNYITLTAIVSMADDGGSTGVLRDELGVLPPGDVRQCLVALSESDLLLRSLMNYRFENGGLGGHSFGNLLLSALEKVTGSFEKAVQVAGKILATKGDVIPVTINKVRLKMILKDNTLLEGEGNVYTSRDIDQGYRDIYLDPYPKANPAALDAIRDADLLIVGPGGIYTSIIPNLLVEGISDAIKESKAEKLFIVNLMNRRGQTTHFKVSNHLKEIERFMGEDVFDHVLVNTARPSDKQIDLYFEEGQLVENDMTSDPRILNAAVLDQKPQERQKGDTFQRNLIRHDAKKLAEEIVKIVDNL